MKRDRDFKAGIDRLQERLVALQEQVSGGPLQAEAVAEALEGLSAGLAQLKSAGEPEGGLVLSLLEVTQQVRAEEALHKALQEAHQRQAEVSALLEGAQTVMRQHEFEAAARSIFDSCKRLTGARAGYVALLDEDGAENEVLFLDAGGAACRVDPSLPMPIRGLREKAYQTGQTVYENDFPHSQWAQLLPDGHAGLDNVLFAPLTIKGITVGLLGLANKPGGFTTNDARLASAFGELAAVALFNSRTLESLQTSEERFRSVVQSASEAILNINSHGKITFWNQAAGQIFGYSPEEAIGQPFTFIIPERFRTAHLDRMLSRGSGGQPQIPQQAMAMVGLGRDGREFPIELSVSRWKSRDEILVTCILRDITERVQAEEEIRSLARFPNEDPNPVLRVSLDGTILYANQAGAPLLDLWDTQVGHKLPDEWRQITTDSINSGERHVSQVTCQDRIFSIDLAPIQSQAYVNLYGHDITRQVQAQAQKDAMLKALQDSEARWRSLTEDSPDPILTLDTNLNIQFANYASPGLTVDQLIGTPLHTYVAEERQAEVKRILENVLKTGQPASYETQYAAPDGSSIYYESRVVPRILQDKVVGLTLSARDVTERVRSEALLREQNQFINTVFESLRHPFYVIDAHDYTIKMANSAAQLGGILERATCYALTHDQATPCSGAGHLCPLEEIKKTGQPTLVEHVHYDGEGQRKIFEVHGYPIFENGGEVTQIIEYTLDITERRQAEEALRERTHELARLLEISRQVALTLELEPLLRLILDQLKGVVDYDAATIFRWGGERLTPLAHRGSALAEGALSAPFSPEKARMGRQMIHNRLPVIIPQVHQDTPLARDLRRLSGDQFEAMYAQANSWMGVPLVAKDQVIGVLALSHAQADR
ncbi:MAG: PAS domain S-box protein, partial [Anaerolineales bacterium]